MKAVDVCKRPSPYDRTGVVQMHFERFAAAAYSKQIGGQEVLKTLVPSMLTV